LARRGYSVHLVDPVPLHVDQAKARSAAQPEAPLASITLGDARDLALESEQVDAASRRSTSRQRICITPKKSRLKSRRLDSSRHASCR
jgi:hypothetical protein